MDICSEDPADRPTRRPRHHAPKVDDALGEDIQRRMAAMKVRRRTNEHDCQAPVTGQCDHPLHRQKVDFALHMLEMLGLDSAYPAYDEKDKPTWLKRIGQSGPAEDDDRLAA